MQTLSGQQTFNHSRGLTKDSKHRGYQPLYTFNREKEQVYLGSYTLQEAETFIMQPDKITVTRENGKKEVIALKPNHDYYTTPNPMKYIVDPITKKKGVRSLANLRGLNSIVVDLDFHNLGIADNEQYKGIVIDLVGLLHQSLFNREVIPEPNKVIFSGRGAHLWWYFEQEYPSETKRKLYLSVVDAIISEIESVINNDYKYSSVPNIIDAGVSKNMWGLIRLAGINQNSKQAVECLYQSDNKYTLQGLAQELDLTNVTNKLSVESITTKEAPKGIKTALSGKVKNMLYARKRIIENVVDAKITDNSYIGHRRNTMFMYYLHLKQLVGHDLAEFKTLELNQRYPKPLKEEEVIAGIKINHVYKVSNKVFYEYLGANKEYAENLNKPKNFVRDTKRKQSRKEKEAYIIELLNSDLTYKEIATKLGCSVPTIKRYAKKHNIRRHYSAGA